MARARNLKPGFFTNDKLAELPPLTRLLFAGLWTIADKSGRLEDRPKRIKAEVLPYDNCNIDKMLSSLEPEFITRYEVCGDRFIQINNFNKHQNPHKKEAESTIPAPCLHSTSTVLAPEETGTSPEISGASPADSLNLIPDSLNPSPENPVPDSVSDADFENRVHECGRLYEQLTGKPASGQLSREIIFRAKSADLELVKEAIRISHDKQNPAPYMAKVMQGWEKSGIKTYADYLAKVAPQTSTRKGGQGPHDENHLPLDEIEDLIRRGKFN